jgi:hypothetical protein
MKPWSTARTIGTTQAGVRQLGGMGIGSSSQHNYRWNSPDHSVSFGPRPRCASKRRCKLRSHALSTSSNEVGPGRSDVHEVTSIPVPWILICPLHVISRIHNLRAQKEPEEIIRAGSRLNAPRTMQQAPERESLNSRLCREIIKNANGSYDSQHILYVASTTPEVDLAESRLFRHRSKCGAA